MPQVTVTSTTIYVYGNNTFFQNLGPGVLYVGGDASHGVAVQPGQAIVLGAVSTVELVADQGDCDVRYMVAGSAIHSTSSSGGMGG